MAVVVPSERTLRITEEITPVSPRSRKKVRRTNKASGGDADHDALLSATPDARAAVEDFEGRWPSSGKVNPHGRCLTPWQWRPCLTHQVFLRLREQSNRFVVCASVVEQRAVLSCSVGEDCCVLFAVARHRGSTAGTTDAVNFRPVWCCLSVRMLRSRSCFLGTLWPR